MKYLVVILFMLFSMEILAQAVPSSYTVFLGLRKYNSGDNPGADSLNQNLDDIDLGVKVNDDTLDAVKADLYNFADYSGDLQLNVVGVGQLKTDIDTSHVKTTGTDNIYGIRNYKNTVNFDGNVNFDSSVVLDNDFNEITVYEFTSVLGEYTMNGGSEVLPVDAFTTLLTPTDTKDTVTHISKSGLKDGQIIIIRIKYNVQVTLGVVIIHGTNIFVDGGANWEMKDNDSITLQYDLGSDKWMTLARSDINP